MLVPANGPNTIAVTEFKAHCLAVIVLIVSEMPDLWGAMRGSVTVAPGTDLTAGTFALLDADA